MCVWGTVDPLSEAMAMRVGLPAATLALAGARGLPDGYVLPLDLHGTLRSPALDLPAAMRKVAVLSAMQLGRSLGAAALGGGGAKAGGSSGLAADGTAGVGGAGGGGGGGGGGAAPMAHLGRASAAFLRQVAAVDARLQAELGGPPPPPPVGPLPFGGGGGGGGGGGSSAQGGGGGGGAGRWHER